VSKTRFERENKKNLGLFMKASFLLQRLTTGTYKLKRKVVHNIVL